MESAFQSGIASASLQVVLEKIANFAVRETSLILGVDDELRRLQRTLQRIRAILDSVENNHLSLINHSSNEAWKMWLVDVEKLSYCADDLLDEISLDISRVHTDNSDNANNSNLVRSNLLSSFKLSMPHEICKIRKELEHISTEMDSLFLSKLSAVGSYKMHTPLNNNFCATSSLVDEEFVVGREKDKEDIIQMLLMTESSRGNLSVIPLVGMGGIGKTTLAQVVYNDERILKNFEFRIWISVSINFDLIGISKSVVESLTGKKCKLSDLDPIQSKLQNLLFGRKFLLVLDDYWTEKYGDWDALCSPLRVGRQGSKVIVTTRSTIVSSILGTIRAYGVQSLNDEVCWELVKQRAFSSKDEREKMNLEEIGRKIAKKCKGLPLAAKCLGGILRFRSDEEGWNSVLNSKMWELPQDQNEIFSALILSYHFLPTHLRKCFAYCSIFPPNHEFEMEELVLLWVGEGFIQPRREMRLEDIGNDFFSELIWRSFFQFSHVNLHNQSIYKMHELIHCMAQLISANTCFRLEEDIQHWPPAFNNARHLSLSHESVQSIGPKAFAWFRQLRTLIMSTNDTSVSQVPYELFLKLQFLRVLNLSHMGIDELPSSIDRLKHLRYLNLSENHIQKLPEPTSNLLALQTLKLKSCFEFFELPTNMKNLTNLRHLDLDVKHQLNYMPSGFGNLVNLQTLSAFIVGRARGCGIRELKNMRFLRGSLCITNLENVLSPMEAKEANLFKKPYLKKLQLEWNCLGDKIDEQEVLAGLQPHENLKELSISGYNGVMFPSWISNPVYKLTNIHLHSCLSCSILPSLGQLPLLKFLCIEDMAGLVHVDHHFCGFGSIKGFPSLESLIFQDMPNMATWRGLNGDDLPCLRELTMSNCSRLTSLPSLHNLNFLHNLNIGGCPRLQALPEEGLPESLQLLIIVDSAIIKERCRADVGEDWHKINRIPKIEIDYVEIPIVVHGV
ncbi:disease resistance protein RGA2-like [Coffea arabica]|uniref:Disease resistance protein RGA2-like n=2 Tax=Coffea TaxID=13442 RepID=A0A6P6T0K9_COFAR|nr:disease resistance protein RGA2-like [Coffea arabica]